MAEQDNTSQAYALADEWISIILSTDPSLLVGKVSPTKAAGDGKPAEFNFNDAVHRARALAEFRQQLGNALAAHHHLPSA